MTLPASAEAVTPCEQKLFAVNPASPDLAIDVENTLRRHVPPSAAAQIFDVIAMMNTRLGGALILGSGFKPLSKMTLAERQKALQSLASSALFAPVFKVLKGLSSFMFYATPEYGALEAINYGALNTETDRPPVTDLSAEEATIQRALLDLTESAARLALGADRAATVAAVADLLRAKGLVSTAPDGSLTAAERQAIDAAAYPPRGKKCGWLGLGSKQAAQGVTVDLVIDGLDVVVCGSGAGGGVAAHTLASKGLRVSTIQIRMLARAECTCSMFIVLSSTAPSPLHFDVCISMIHVHVARRIHSLSTTMRAGPRARERPLPPALGPGTGAEPGTTGLRTHVRGWWVRSFQGRFYGHSRRIDARWRHDHQLVG